MQTDKQQNNTNRVKVLAAVQSYEIDSGRLVPDGINARIVDTTGKVETVLIKDFVNVGDELLIAKEAVKYPGRPVTEIAKVVHNYSQLAIMNCFLGKKR